MLVDVPPAHARVRFWHNPGAVMGSFASGNRWRYRQRKRTVEESLVLSVRHFAKAHTGANGTIRWSRGSSSSSVVYRVGFAASGPFVYLGYELNSGEEVTVPVRLCYTSARSNGYRLWFECPISRNGAPCGRRAAKLYLPTGARHFGCRACHDLTYRSSQRAHYAERLERVCANMVARFGSSADATSR